MRKNGKNEKKMESYLGDIAYESIKLDTQILDLQEKNYVEIFSPNYDKSDLKTQIMEVNSNNPIPELNDNIIKLRYFKQKEVQLQDKVFTTKPYDYSPMIYNGQIIKIEDIETLYINIYDIMDLESTDTIICCKDGTILVNPEPNSITVDDLENILNNLNVKKKIKK